MFTTPGRTDSTRFANVAGAPTTGTTGAGEIAGGNGSSIWCGAESATGGVDDSGTESHATRKRATPKTWSLAFLRRNKRRPKLVENGAEEAVFIFGEVSTGLSF